MSQPKVFEFAKEIGIETLVLMDKIREWKLPVKSHMAELSPEIIDEIRAKLSGDGEEESASKKKKKKTKKKATKKTAAKKTTAKKKKTATKKTASKKKVTKKVVTKKTVVRKKAGAAEEVAEEEKAPTKRTTVVRKKKAVETVAAEAVEAAEVATDQVADQELGTDTDAQTAQATAEASQTQESTEAQASEQTETTQDASATKESETDDKKKGTTKRKREVSMTKDGPVSGVKSERPRGNIVGRMDLSRVRDIQKTQPNRNTRGGVRTGYVTEDEAKKMRSSDDNRTNQNQAEVPLKEDTRKDKDKRRTATTTTGPGAKDANKGKEEEKQPVFNTSEFRKREMVFQPRKKKGMLNREAKKTQITTPKASKRVVKVYDTIKVSDLAQDMGIKMGQLTKVLIQNGIMANPNASLDFDTVSLIVPEFGWEAENISRSEDELIDAAAFGNLDAEPVTRPPIVTVMGHVDHGKTTLLDTIRKANVVKGEAGGITQHIGAYQVKTDNGVTTFIDTPGHEAFTAMRARGANVTDIAIIVVAADDGVMPQTIEAINHAKAAEVPIIVAVNKIDKPQANPDKITQQLTEYELVPEEWGGDTPFCKVSALEGDGIPELLDQITLLAEIAEYKANPQRSATGIVVESKIEKGRGAVATVLVQDGTLKVGQTFIVGTVPGRVRSLMDHTGKNIKEAGPSVPVEIMGLKDAPMAGDRFDVTVDEKTAEQISEKRLEEKKQEENKPASKMSLEDLFSKVQTGDLKELPVVLKTDVAGSGEAIIGMFNKIESEEVKIKVIHQAVGGISESDVLLASTANGIIVGFNVRPDGGAQRLASDKGIEIKCYSIVYELMDDIKKALSGLLDPDVVEVQLGRAEVRDTFSVPKIGMIAGCYVEDGKITRNSLLRLVRDGKVVYEGNVSSLKRFKDDAKEVQSGYECGIGIENFNDIKVGDFIEAFMKEERQRELQ